MKSRLPEVDIKTNLFAQEERLQLCHTPLPVPEAEQLKHQASKHSIKGGRWREKGLIVDVSRKKGAGGRRRSHLRDFSRKISSRRQTSTSVLVRWSCGKLMKTRGTWRRRKSFELETMQIERRCMLPKDPCHAMRRGTWAQSDVAWATRLKWSFSSID